MTTLLYSQKSGNFYNSGSPVLQPIYQGYAGAGEHKNNPESQCISNLGPIPCGVYEMGEVEDIGGLSGAIRLTPHSENDMCGRSGFLIHGDSASAPGWASEGCIILSPAAARQSLAENFDRLQVVKYDPVSLSQVIPQTEAHGFDTMQYEDEEVDPPTDSSTLPFYLGHAHQSFIRRVTNRIVDRSAIVLPDKPSGSGVQNEFGLVATREDFERAFP